MYVKSTYKIIQYKYMQESQAKFNKTRNPDGKKKKFGGFVLSHTAQVRDRVARVVSPELAEEARLALFDPSTGLPNRRAMSRRFEELSRFEQTFAVIMVDIDDFKQTNTNVGHENADELLLKFAKKLRETVRQNDQITYVGETFRTGGDEFILLAPLLTHSEESSELTSQQRLDALLRRLGSECCDGIVLEDLSGQEVEISATCVGVVVDQADNLDKTGTLNDLSLEVTRIKKSRTQPSSFTEQ